MVETRRGRTGEVKLEGIEGRKSKRNVKVEIVSCCYVYFTMCPCTFCLFSFNQVYLLAEERAEEVSYQEEWGITHKEATITHEENTSEEDCIDCCKIDILFIVSIFSLILVLLGDVSN